MNCNRLLITNISAEHYFYRQTGGILMRTLGRNGIWSEPKCAVDNAREPFCVISDSKAQRHIICVDDRNRLIYAINRGSCKKSYLLSELRGEIVPKKMGLVAVCDRLNLLYSASYGDKFILVHCVLGDKCRPRVIDTSTSAHFWIFDKRIYYKNSQGALGYLALDGCNPEFVTLFDDGDNISAYRYCDKEFLVYNNNSKLYLDGKELIYDSRMEMPVMTKSGEKLYVMWKSGGYVRYMTTRNLGKSWEKPMLFMASGAEIRRFWMSCSGNDYAFYGYSTPCEVNLFSRPDIFYR